MKKRDTFQSERRGGRRVARAVVLSEGKRQVEPQRRMYRVDIRIRCVRVGMRTQYLAATLCRVGDPDGGVQWLSEGVSRQTGRRAGGQRGGDLDDSGCSGMHQTAINDSDSRGAWTRLAATAFRMWTWMQR